MFQRPNPQPLPFREGEPERDADLRSLFSDSPSLKGRGRGLGCRCWGASRGFTLLEIMVVLFLMGLIMLIAMPYMGGLTDAQLKSASRRLAGRATYLYDEASARKLVIQLVFDLDTNSYFVMT